MPLIRPVTLTRGPLMKFRLPRRKKWYCGTVGDNFGGFRVSKREVLDAWIPLDNGTWDSQVYRNGPLLSGSFEAGYFSYRNPFYPDKRIYYKRV
jgi:hypothetical protein